MTQLLVGLTLLSGGSGVVQIHHGAFGPDGTILLARPQLTWQVWPTGAAVAGAEALIDGIAAEATYDHQRREATALPRDVLAPGTHQVKLTLRLENGATTSKEWSFSVSRGSLPKLPAHTADQLEVRKAANSFRSTLGLPEVELDGRLSAAAQAHSFYLAKNNATGHAQKMGQPAFLGQSPTDRVKVFGFVGGSWETVDYGARTATQAVHNLLNAPYHRIPFMQPGEVRVGSGFVGQRLTVAFGSSVESETVVSPCDGETGVPLAWDATERPDPLRLHKFLGKAGHILVFAHFTRERSAVKIRLAKLADSSGKELELAVNHSPNDPYLREAALLIPSRPLLPRTKYSVRVVADVEGSGGTTRVEKQWSFTTKS